MKIFGQLSPFATPLALAFSLLVSTGNVRASGPGGAGTTGGVSGTSTTGAVGAGVSTAGASRGSVGSVGAGIGSVSAPAARSGVSISNNAPRPSGGTFTQGAVSRPGAPAAFAPGGRIVSPVANGTRPGYASTTRGANTWSGAAVNPTSNAEVRGSANPLYPSNGFTNNRFTGRPSAWNGSNNNRGDDRSHRYGDGNGRYRIRSRYYNYPYAYGPAYAPYIAYYGGGYEGAYPYYADGSYPDVGNGGTPTVTPQYGDQGQDANNDQRDPAPQTVPQNPNGNANVQPTVPNNGPDSLVEAVQQELIRRGYFAGKVDAMYGPDTKEALRKFQQDHHLADSGLINEATLHALQLD